MRFITLLMVLLVSINCFPATTKNLTALSAATATGAGDSFPNLPWEKSCQATGETTAGAGATAVEIQVSNDGSFWMVAGTISLTLSTTEATDGFAINALWKYLRANVSSISGTGAYVTVTCNYKVE